MNQKNNQNQSLYFLKGIACIAVVFIHFRFPGAFGNVIAGIGRFAVPVFFMISGYFAYGASFETIRKRLRKIALIFLGALLLYFLYELASGIKDPTALENLKNYFNLLFPVKFFFFCDVDFAVPLWYFIAIIETYLLWLLALKKNFTESLTKLIPVLFLIQIVLTIYCDSKNLDWYYKTNFITSALPWFLTGFVSRRFKKRQPLNLFAACLLGSVIIALPVILDLSLQFSCVGVLPLSLGLFLFALNSPEKSPSKILSYIGQYLSLPIYIFHCLINGILSTILEGFFKIPSENSVYLWIKPLLILFSSILFSFLLTLLIHRIRKKNRLSISENHIEN